MVLEREIAYFNAHRDDWLAQGRSGQWAVVHQADLLGFFPAVQDGFAAGVAKWGAVPFLVKKVAPQDTVGRVTRFGRFIGGSQQPA